MKRIVYLTIEVSPLSLRTLEEIKEDGYNATVVTSESLRHAMEILPEERHFINLRNLDISQNNESILCLFVVDEEKVEHLKEVIRKNTENFKKIKGFMFSQLLEDYEGSI